MVQEQVFEIVLFTFHSRFNLSCNGKSLSQCFRASLPQLKPTLESLKASVKYSMDIADLVAASADG